MKRLAIISLHYYALLWAYNLAFTLLATVIVWGYIGVLNPMTFFIAKAVGYLSSIFLHNYSSSKSYYYFMNAGYKISRVILNAATIDFLVYLFIIFIASIFKACLH